jgi:hypothetical protein
VCGHRGVDPSGEELISEFGVGAVPGVESKVGGGLDDGGLWGAEEIEGAVLTVPTRKKTRGMRAHSSGMKWAVGFFYYSLYN